MRGLALGVRIGAKPAVATSKLHTLHHDPLHAAVLAAPDDDAPRLVYADWLKEHGDPRGDLIALGLAGSPSLEGIALWDAHGATWNAAVRGLTVDYRRGFVEVIRGRGAELARELAAAVRDACVRELIIDGELDRAPALVPTWRAMRLRRLELRGGELTPGELRAALAAPAAAALETLAFVDVPLGAAHVEALATAPLAGLSELGFARCGLGPETVAALGAGPWRPRALALADNPLGTLRGLDRATARLARLDVAWTRIGDADVVAIGAAAPLAELDLTGNRLGIAAFCALARIATLRRLDLGFTGITAGGLDALVASKALPRTLELGLDAGTLGLRYEEWIDPAGGTVIDAFWDGDVPRRLARRFRLRAIAKASRKYEALRS